MLGDSEKKIPLTPSALTQSTLWLKTKSQHLRGAPSQGHNPAKFYITYVI